MKPGYSNTMLKLSDNPCVGKLLHYQEWKKYLLWHIVAFVFLLWCEQLESFTTLNTADDMLCTKHVHSLFYYWIQQRVLVSVFYAKQFPHFVRICRTIMFDNETLGFWRRTHRNTKSLFPAQIHTDKTKCFKTFRTSTATSYCYFRRIMTTVQCSHTDDF